MNQRLYWRAFFFLVLITGLIDRSTAGLVGKADAPEACDSDGVIGTFSQDTAIDSLTVTLANYTDLKVDIVKTETEDNYGIQIYLTVDEDSACTTKEFKFQIYPTGQTDMAKACVFAFTLENKHITYKTKTFPLVYDGAFQASFEVQEDGNDKTKMIFNQPSGDDPDSLTDEGGPPCIKLIDKLINFTMAIIEPKSVTGKDTECGIQLEMKGEYNATKLTMKDKPCALEEPGSSNDVNPPGTTEMTGTTSPKKDPFPTWAIIVVSVVGGLLLLIVIGLLIYFLVCRKKKESNPDENVEEAKEEDGENEQAPEDPATDPNADPDAEEQNESSAKQGSEKKEAGSSAKAANDEEVDID